MTFSFLAAIYITIAIWFVAGLLFALPFALFGAHKLPAAHLSDPVSMTVSMTWGARLAVIPGAIVLWPYVLWRWLRHGQASTR